MENVFCTCCVCSVSHPLTEMKEHEGSYYCQDCFNKDFFVCEICSETFTNDDCYEQGGNCYCRDCFRENFFTCENCRETFHNDNCHSHDSSYYCYDCFHENFTRCVSCGDTVSNDYIVYHEPSGNDYCEGCYPGEEEGNAQNLHDYSYKPMPRFLKSVSEKTGRNTCFFGIELEVETKENSFDAYAFENDWFYFKSDSSLDDGFELVTHPFTYDFYKSTLKAEFVEILKTFINAGYESFTPGTCGIHIHMSKSAFTTIHLYKFLKFFYENLNFIHLISQRNENSNSAHCSWGKNKEQVYPKDCCCLAKEKRGYQRYTAVNLQNPDTIEVRIFRGTLFAPSFHKNIEFLRSLFLFTEKTGIKNITVSNYIKYVRNSDGYPNLIGFLTKKGF